MQAWPPLTTWLSAAPDRCQLITATEEMTVKLSRQLKSFGRGAKHDLAQNCEVRTAFCLACNHMAAYLQQAKCVAVAPLLPHLSPNYWYELLVGRQMCFMKDLVHDLTLCPE